jgi:signal transduction histidine kinase
VRVRQTAQVSLINLLDITRKGEAPESHICKHLPMLFKPCILALLHTWSSDSIFGSTLSLTEWSCLAAIFILAILLWTAYRIRLTGHTNRVCNMLAERLSERERRTRELNDTLLQGMQGLILLFQGAVVEISSGSPVGSRLEAAISRAERLMVEAHDQVRGLHAPNLDLADALRSLNAEQPLPETEYSVKVIGRKRELQPLVSDEVFKIAREAVGNAFQHASAGYVCVTLIYRFMSLNVIVADDGSDGGMDVSEDGRAGRWGYSGMKGRARKLEGKLLISNRSPRGTEVQLNVPSRVAYRAQSWFLAEWLQTVKYFMQRRGH